MSLCLGEGAVSDGKARAREFFVSAYDDACSGGVVFVFGTVGDTTCSLYRPGGRRGRSTSISFLVRRDQWDGLGVCGHITRLCLREYCSMQHDLSNWDI
jgi:hypothetical protein